MLFSNLEEAAVDVSSCFLWASWRDTCFRFDYGHIVGSWAPAGQQVKAIPEGLRSTRFSGVQWLPKVEIETASRKF